MAKQGQIVSKRPQAYLDVSLGSFLAYDIDTILNSLLLSHSSQNLSKVYTLIYSASQALTALQQDFQV